jgi:transposase InsO family protein
MGRVGACGDNAAMNSFFTLLQKNVPNRKRWKTRHELRLRNSETPPADLAAVAH